MGIIRAAAEALGTSLADQWLEVIEAEDMSDRTVFTKGVKIRNGQNKKGLDDVVSNGSVIHVYPNQFMMLVDGGKVVDYTAEEGYYKVDNSSMPSQFRGSIEGDLRQNPVWWPDTVKTDGIFYQSAGNQRNPFRHKNANQLL